MYAKKLFSLLIVVTLFAFLAGCGGGGTSTPAPQPAPTPVVTPSTAVQVKVGDAPADRVISFEMTLKSLVLDTKTGDKATIISEPRRIEFVRLAGSLEPVAMLSIPQGTYTKGTLVTADPHIAYVNDAGEAVEYTLKGDTTTLLTLDPALVIGKTVSLINADLNLAASITSIDGSATNPKPPKFAPVAAFSISTIAASDQKDETGALQHAVGLVTSATADSFTLKVGQNGIELDFAVDASTEFQNVTLTTLPDMLVHVSAISASDGTLHATNVEGLTNAKGAVLEGIIVGYTLSGEYYDLPTSITLVSEDGIGNGMANELVGKSLTIDVANANYGVDTQDLFDMPNVSPYVFLGQKVRVDTDTGIVPTEDKKGYTSTARMVTLEQQVIMGVVVEQPPYVAPQSAVHYSRYLGSIWVHLPADSSLMLLGHAEARMPYVLVWIATDTLLHGAAIPDLMGKTVRLRGFLGPYFWNNPADTFAMDATSLEVVTPTAEPMATWTRK